MLFRDSSNAYTNVFLKISLVVCLIHFAGLCFQFSLTLTLSQRERGFGYPTLFVGQSTRTFDVDILPERERPMKRLNQIEPVPRLVPQRDFPSYSFVPGYFPHPINDPEGHRYGEWEREVDEPDPEHWTACEDYLYGIDLFNHGYYWEAHEAWEDLWNACGRVGVCADFFKALIKLAAAGVKVKTDTPSGVLTHANGAATLFHQIQDSLGGTGSYMGLDLNELISYAEAIAEHPPSGRYDDDESSAIVFDFVLLPSEV